MPAVTSVGGVKYLQLLGRQYPSVQEELRNFLTELDRASHAMFRTAFEELPGERRVHLVSELDKHSAPKLFGLIKYVYEAYYTQPRVLDLIACESKLSSAPGDDDEILLFAVRKMRHKYREVD
jgi:hypothetical protein